MSRLDIVQKLELKKVDRGGGGAYNVWVASEDVKCFGLSKGK